MGQFVKVAPALTGIRFRDDYGAAMTGHAHLIPASFPPFLSRLTRRILRSFSLVQLNPVAIMGELNNAA